MKRRQFREWILALGLVIGGTVVLLYGPATRHALAGGPGSQMCGDWPYDPSREGCCNGNVYTLATQGCCNGYVYNLIDFCCCPDDGVSSPNCLFN